MDGIHLMGHVRWCICGKMKGQKNNPNPIRPLTIAMSLRLPPNSVDLVRDSKPDLSFRHEMKICVCVGVCGCVKVGACRQQWWNVCMCIYSSVLSCSSTR